MPAQRSRDTSKRRRREPVKRGMCDSAQTRAPAPRVDRVRHELAGQLERRARDAARAVAQLPARRRIAGERQGPAARGPRAASTPPRRGPASRGATSRRRGGAGGGAAAGGGRTGGPGAASATTRPGASPASRSGPRCRSGRRRPRAAALPPGARAREVGVLPRRRRKGLVEAPEALEELARIDDVARLHPARRRIDEHGARERRRGRQRRWSIGPGASLDDRPGCSSAAASARSSQPGGGRQSSSVKATSGAPAARQPALRLRPGPARGDEQRPRASGWVASSSVVSGVDPSWTTTTSKR